MNLDLSLLLSQESTENQELLLKVIHQNQLIQTKKLELEILKLRSQNLLATDTSSLNHHDLVNFGEINPSYISNTSCDLNSPSDVPVDGNHTRATTPNSFENLDEYLKLFSDENSCAELPTLTDSNDHGLANLGLMENMLPDLPEEHALHLFLNSASEFQCSHSTVDECTEKCRDFPTQAAAHNVIKSNSNISKDKAKKKYLTQQAFCLKCNTPVASIYLHCNSKCGSFNEVLASYSLEVECINCSKMNSFGSTDLVETTSVKTKRKRIGGYDSDFSCYVCKRKVGQGGFRCISYSHCSTAPCSRHLTNIDKTTLDIEGHKSEIVCNDCEIKYQFCTECGGGGKFRTGKYRSKELFQNRKTCCLSHVRLSGQNISYQVFEKELDYETLELLKCVHEESLNYLLAMPDVMEFNLAFANMDLIRGFIRDSWAESLNTFRKPGGMLAVALIDAKKWRKNDIYNPLGKIPVGYLVGHVDAETLTVQLFVRVLNSSSVSIVKDLLNTVITKSAVAKRLRIMSPKVCSEKVFPIYKKMGFQQEKGRGEMEYFTSLISDVKLA